MLRFLVGEIALAPDLSQSQRGKVFRRIPVLRLLLPGFFVQHPLYHAAVFGAAYALLPTGTVVAVLPCCLISFLMPVLVVAGVLLFHFIQRIKHAVPLLRKMPITTSADHERYGADAIHYKVEDNKNIIILGEAKAYTSKYQFAAAFEKAVKSILDTYANFRSELNLYLHEDFLDRDLDLVAEELLNNTLPNVKIELVSLVLYDENKEISLTSEEDIKAQIEKIIQDRYSSFDNSKIDISANPILRRITYIVFPVWNFDKLAEEFQHMI